MASGGSDNLSFVAWQTTRESYECPVRWSTNDENGRSWSVIEARFAHAGDEPRTLPDIGSELGVSRERVRQIELATRARLRNDDVAKSIAR